MIRTQAALAMLLKDGETLSRLDAGERRWSRTSTDEVVHGQAVKWAIKNDLVKVIQSDIDGQPMQYGPA